MLVVPSLRIDRTKHVSTLSLLGCLVQVGIWGVGGLGGWHKNWHDYRGALDLPEKVSPNFMTSPKVVMSSIFPGNFSRRVAKIYWIFRLGPTKLP